MNCPFIDSDNPRCSEILNIQHLEQAFELCTNRYTLCSVFIQLSETLAGPKSPARDKLELVGANP